MKDVVVICILLLITVGSLYLHYNKVKGSAIQSRRSRRSRRNTQSKLKWFLFKNR